MPWLAGFTVPDSGPGQVHSLPFSAIAVLVVKEGGQVIFVIRLEKPVPTVFVGFAVEEQHVMHGPAFRAIVGVVRFQTISLRKQRGPKMESISIFK